MVKFLSLQWNTATFSVLTVHIKSNYLEKEKYDFSKKQKTLKKKKQPQQSHCSKGFFSVFNNLEYHCAWV